MIWEIGPNGEELRTLRARLSLASVYLTRVMGSLEKQGPVTVRSTKQDGMRKPRSLHPVMGALA